MKRKTILSLLILVILGLTGSQLAMAVEDYRCYAKASDGNYYLTGGYANSAQEAKANTMGKSVHNQNNRRFIIQYVEECVAFGESFSSTAAQQLDERTPH